MRTRTRSARWTEILTRIINKEWISLDIVSYLRFKVIIIIMASPPVKISRRERRNQTIRITMDIHVYFCPSQDNPFDALVSRDRATETSLLSTIREIET